MFLEFFILINIIVGEEIVKEVSSACRCQQILSEKDCNQKCKWNLEKKKCFDRKCTEIEEEEACFSRNCNFIENQCQSLDDCSDILIKYFCNLNSKCIYDDQNLNCRDEINEEIDCSSFKTKKSCQNNIDSNNNYCIWIDNDVEDGYVKQPGNDFGTCKSYPFETCDSANLIFHPIELCERNQFQCIWSNESCQQKDCTLMGNDEQLCKENFSSIREGKKILLCSWNVEKKQCENGFNVSTLREEQCYNEKTLFQLTFDEENKKCTKCPGMGYIIVSSLLFQLIFL
ncbi:unnamed protein product [Paramecium sonneborni]|uniref:Uncharacterized protein n=1 Tax=Paramecium sonneborni TaxID=65129 RepID=A0A8S1KH95_9CILI|nr:unnamed protein product [Paramecium sonneborni]